LQYRIWRHRQRLELKRTVIRDMQKVTTEYLYKYSATNHLPFSERYRPREESEPDFVQSLRIVVDNIKCLFSDETFTTFKYLSDMIPLHPDKENELGIKEFREAQQTALKAMYKELRLV